MKRSSPFILSTCIGLILAVGPASANWSLLSDFEALNVGPLGTQGGWTSAPEGNYHVAVDPSDASNQALLMNAPGGDAYLPLGGGIAEGETGTLFFRARNDNPGDLVFGSSDVAAPSEWGDYEGYMRFASGNLDVRDGGGFATGSTYNTNEWTNVWLVIDNAADTTTMYTSVGFDAPGNSITGAFRNTTTDTLVTTNLRAGNTHEGREGYVDDIYLSAGTNLTNPVPEPSTGLLAALGLVGLINMARRRMAS